MEATAEKKSILFTLGEAGEILGSISEGDPGFHRASIYGISTDSRTIREGELFVAIKGDTYDGHAFLAQAMAKGAVAAVVDRVEAERRGLTGPEYIGVKDPLYALGELARHYRGKMAAVVTAITGSNGKTTVKNLVYDIISKRFPAVKSHGNFNNLIGLPLSIFQLRPDHKFAVFELGMSARGEILRLGDIAGPDVAVITNVGPVHLEFLKSVDQVAEAKLEIIEGIKSSGTLVINGDDENLKARSSRIRRGLLKFGLEPHNDIKPVGLQFDSARMPSFSVDNHEITVRMPGVHNVYNALAAYAVARALGIDGREAADSISVFHPEGMRSEVVNYGGVTMIVDCYNANPASMAYALETLSQMNCEGKRIAVLGDMLELGEQSVHYHNEVGRQARELGIDYIFGFGLHAKYITDRFGIGGRHFDKKEGLSKSLLETVKAGDLILFKGSRGMALEEVVETLKRSI
jgi:UDP-N-acetylmuramoyl-tripeptide--D-alanyl-D-alanine ligase